MNGIISWKRARSNLKPLLCSISEERRQEPLLHSIYAPGRVSPAKGVRGAPGSIDICGEAKVRRRGVTRSSSPGHVSPTP